MNKNLLFIAENSLVKKCAFLIIKYKTVIVKAKGLFLSA